MTRGTTRQRLFPGCLSPALHVYERFKFLLLMSIEALFFLLLIGRKFFQVATLFQVQPVVLLLLMSTEGCPVLLPPRLVEIVLIQFRCLYACCCLRTGLARLPRG